MAFELKRKYISSKLEEVIKEILKNKKNKLVIKKNGDEIICSFCLDINDWYSLSLNTKQLLKNGWDDGLAQFLYTNDECCILFNLRVNSVGSVDALAGLKKPQVEKYYTSAVHGYFYDYDEVNKLLTKF